MGEDERFDVVVVGGGNAGFCAAHAAAERGAAVLLLEKAPAEQAGGNSFYTAGAFRFAFDRFADIADLLEPDERHADSVVPDYPESAFEHDMRRITDGRCDPVLTNVLVSRSADTVRWLAGKGVKVELYEQKPAHFSPAHKSEGFAELICSNSLKAERLDSASGLLKEEMRRMGSQLLNAAEVARVAAGGALAVDRDTFSAEVTRMVEAEPNITVHRERVEHIDESAPILVATGPLTDGALADEIGRLTGDERLHFYDAVAPIVTAESLDYEKVFAASRYDRGEADYLNCPFNKAEYEAFHAALASAERAPLHEFDAGAEQGAQPDPDAHGKKADTVTVYEGCMPIEIMAARGADTMRFGPLRPVGLMDPRTGHRPWANVQLRAENKERTLYNIVGFQTNLKWGEQKRVFSMIPGLENAEFVRYGVMHRNTFLDAPRVLSAGLCLKEHPNVFFAGQITGFEGYMESAACGLLAARNIYARLEGKELPAPPIDTMCGALIQYLTTENKHFQPMGANMGILPPLPEDQRPRDKRLRYMAVAERAVASFQQWLDENSL